MEAELARRLGADPLGEAGVGRIRAFFGLPLPEEQREALAGFLARCAEVAPGFRWTPAGNLHLTVRFLGHVEQSLAEGIAARVEAAHPAAFELALGDIGSFKRGRLARVVWLGLRQGDVDIAPLAQLVEAESVVAGLEPEGRRYHAHLTLARARAREGTALSDLPAPPLLPSWHADELVLFQSHLGRGGSAYDRLRTIRLR